jgi:hypothetical protein
MMENEWRLVRFYLNEEIEISDLGSFSIWSFDDEVVSAIEKEKKQTRFFSLIENNDKRTVVWHVKIKNKKTK